MSERNGDNKVGIVQVGMGPGGTGFVLAAERMGKIATLKASGFLVLERAPQREVGIGYLQFFPGVDTNSHGGHLTDQLSREVQAALAQTAEGKRIQEQSSSPVKLSDAIGLQRQKGGVVRDLLGGSLRTGVDVISLMEFKNHGGPEYWAIDQYGRMAARSDIVILSTGAEERIDPELNNDSLKGKTLLSKDILGNGQDVKKNHQRLAKARNVVIVGASHSGGLAAKLALEQSGAQVKLLSRGEVAIHSPSKEEAEAAGLEVTAAALADDPDGIQPWRFKGSRGDARDTLIRIINGEEPRASLSKGSYGDFETELAEADIILQCTGLKWRGLPIIRENNWIEPAAYQQSGGRVAITPEGNPYVMNEKGVFAPEERVFVVGMGSYRLDGGPNPHAINFYEGIIGEARVNAVLAASTSIQERQSILLR